MIYSRLKIRLKISFEIFNTLSLTVPFVLLVKHFTANCKSVDKILIRIKILQHVLLQFKSSSDKSLFCVFPLYFMLNFIKRPRKRFKTLLKFSISCSYFGLVKFYYILLLSKNCMTNDWMKIDPETKLNFTLFFQNVLDLNRSCWKSRLYF